MVLRMSVARGVPRGELEGRNEVVWEARHRLPRAQQSGHPSSPQHQRSSHPRDATHP